MGLYINGAVSVTSAATFVCTVGAESDGVLVANIGSTAVVLGGSGVTATTGIPLAASASVLVPSVGGVTHDLYAITASSTSTVTFLFPSA